MTDSAKLSIRKANLVTNEKQLYLQHFFVEFFTNSAAASSYAASVGSSVRPLIFSHGNLPSLDTSMATWDRSFCDFNGN